MTEFAEEVAALALDFAGSLWGELGLYGAPRRHDWLAIDLEPLLIFTATSAAADACLKSRTLEWCLANSRHVSMYRLKVLSRIAGPAGHSASEPFAAALASGRDKPRKRGHNTPQPDLRRPSLIQLRLRAMAGVSARAEVLKLLLAAPDEPRTMSALVGPAAYGKSAVAQALESLTMAGITKVEHSGNRLVYRIARPNDLIQALNGLPAVFPDWTAIFNITQAIIDYTRRVARDREPVNRVPAASRLVREREGDITRLGIAGRMPRITGPGSIEEFELWARSFVAEEAGAATTSNESREVRYTVHRLALGGWLATVTEAGEQPRPLALSDGPELRPERRAHRRMKLDDISAAAEVIEMMLLDMRTRDRQRREGSVVARRLAADSPLPAMSREFSAELLGPLRKGQAASFTEDFMQKWFANRRERFGVTA